MDLISEKKYVDTRLDRINKNVIDLCVFCRNEMRFDILNQSHYINITNIINQLNNLKIIYHEKKKS